MSVDKKQQDYRTLFKRALLKLEELQANVDKLNEPIAVIGLGCRFPNGANGPDEFWDLLSNGINGISEIPKERWDADAYYDPNPDAPGKMYTKRAGFIDQVDQFDPQFFGIAPREAVAMDPQQRLLLETTWHALEHAAQAPNKLEGSRTGVFVGLTCNDYAHLQTKAGDQTFIDTYFATGTAHSVAAGRISYLLGLEGPSVTVDSACSASMMAIHLACQSMRMSESDMTIVGGVNVVLAPDGIVTASQAKMLSPDGHCKTFDAAADGYVRSEGCAVVVLKRLSDAVANNDNVLAVIRGTAANQDGRSTGLTVPSGSAQEAVIREALEKSGLQPAEISYLETHGTGTSLGDPIEVQSAAAALGEGRPKDKPLLLGAVKSIIGHLEGAAGIAGLAKVILALQHKQIPPSLHVRKLNPHIPWQDLPVKVVTKLMPWPYDGQKAIAGVSSFGFSGTNVHVIVEQAPHAEPAVSGATPKVLNQNEEPQQSNETEMERPRHLLCLSAKSESALKELTSRYECKLSADVQQPLADLCFTANAGRAHFSHRVAISADTNRGILDGLQALLAKQKLRNVQVGAASEGSGPKTLFLFTGQGSQYSGMGRQLYKTQPRFKKALDTCDEHLGPLLEEPLLHVLFDEAAASLLNQTAYTQPALFALEYSLAQLWLSWGIVPSAVMGHSVGEYVAACVAGVFSLEDGLRLIAERGRLMQKLPHNGTMASIFADLQQVSTTIEAYQDVVSVAAINGPESVVISGERQAIEEITQSFEHEGITSKPLQVSHAFHSPLMEPTIADFEKLASEVEFSPPKIGLISNVTGTFVSDTELNNPNYWGKHIRQPVQFLNGLREAYEEGCRVFLEIGPRPTLIGMGQRCIQDDDASWLSSLRKGHQDWQWMLNSLASLYVQGVDIDWEKFDADYSRRRTILPTYPFQRNRYWAKAAEMGAHNPYGMHRTRSIGKPLHPLLQGQLQLALSKETVFESNIDLGILPYLNDHRVYGSAVFPAAAYIEMVLEAARASFGPYPHALEEMMIQEAFILSEDESQKVQLILQRDDITVATFKICSLRGDEKDSQSVWITHAQGRIRIVDSGYEVGASTEKHPSIEKVRAECRKELDVESYYQDLQSSGIKFGSSFRGIEHIWRGEGQAFGKVCLPTVIGTDSGAYQLHPVLLDSCFQLLGATLMDNPDSLASDETYMPVSLESFRIYRNSDGPLWCYAEIRERDDSDEETFTGDICLFDEADQILAEVCGLHFKRARRDVIRHAVQKKQNLDDWLCEIDWKPQVRTSDEPLDSLAEYFPAITEIAQHADSQVSPLSFQHEMQTYQKVDAELEALSAVYVLKAFQQLGFELQLGQSFSTASVIRELGLVDQHARLLGRMFEMLEEEEVLRKDGSGWEVCRVPEIDDPGQLCATLLDQFPVCKAELSLIRSCGEHLPEVLRGECDPLQLLFPNGSLSTAEHLNQDTHPSQMFNSLVQEVVSKASERLPRGRKLRILEIGAGTGGTTSYILSVLPAEHAEYVFTDMSQMFLSKAEDKFRDYPFVRYEILDIESDPEAQEFPRHNFDLIIAANVLHATSDLRQTLKHTMQLLAPQGLLVLREGTARQRWVDLTFGLTEGWWKFMDSDLRPAYPLLSQSEWLDLLKKAGFARAETVPALDGDADDFKQAIFIAEAPDINVTDEEATDSAQPIEGDTWVIFADQEGVGLRLSELLKSRDQNCILVSRGKKYRALKNSRWKINPAQPEHFKRLLGEALGPNQRRCRGVVHLWALDVVAEERATTIAVDEAQVTACGSMLHLVQALASVGASNLSGLWLVTRGAQPVAAQPSSAAVSQSPLWGLGKVIAKEHPEFRCVRVDLDAFHGADDTQYLFDEIWLRDAEEEIALRGNTRYVSRLVLSKSKSSQTEKHSEASSVPQRFQLQISSPGVLDGLILEPTKRGQCGPKQVEIRVHATGLNFRDVLTALGTYPGEAGALGLESAGKIVAVGEDVDSFQIGDEVIAVAPGCFSSHVIVSTDMIVRKPHFMSFEDAVTIPSAFLTASYALHHLSRMSAGERILIHAAAGGVGLAAVQLAQSAKAEIFATAGSEEKRSYLTSIGVKHVMNSRSLDFADEILDITDGDGVDIVLNSLTGDFIQKGLSVLSPKGRFIEIGMKEILNESQVEKDISYFTVNLMKVAQEKTNLVKPMFDGLMREFDKKHLKPLPLTEFAIEHPERAFRYMAQAKHIGKIVLTQRHLVKASKTDTQRGDSCTAVTSSCTIPFKSDATYLITGGLAGLGLLVAEWMVERGARHLVLIGRSEPSEEAQAKIRRLENEGAQILLVQADVSDEGRMSGLFAEIDETLPPLMGIIHSAGVLDDGILVRQDWQRFTKVMAPKVHGSWILHTLTRDRELDFFVLFSAGGALIGSAGQGNHVAANAFLDTLAHYRRASGLPALSINWGAWSEVGTLVGHSQSDRITRQGKDVIAPHQGLRILGRLMQEDRSQVGVMPLDWHEFLKQFGREELSPLLTEIVNEAAGKGKRLGASNQKDEFLKQLQGALPSSRLELVVNHVREQVVKVLGLDSSQSLDLHQGLTDVGMDSLMAVELSNHLQVSLGCPIPSTLPFEYPTVATLSEHLLIEVLGMAVSDQGNGRTARDNGQPADEGLADLSENELEESLLKELDSAGY